MATRRLVRSALAAVLLCAMGTARTAIAADVAPDARAHFKAGVAYLEDPEGQRFEEAYAEFSKAYALSHSPKVLGNLGLCAMKLERDGEAIDAYTQYLSEVSDIDPAERAQITRDLATLSASAVTATVTSAAGAATLVDTRSPVRGPAVTNAYPFSGEVLKLRLRPGHHVMHLRAEGRDVADWEFTADAAQHLEHTFEAAPPSGLSPGGASTAHRDVSGPVLLSGVGIAALVVGGVLGGSTLQKVHSLEQQCPDNACPSSVYSNDLATARTFVNATDYTLLGGAVLTVGGVVWFLLSASHDTEPAQSPRVASACMKGGCYASATFGF